MSPVLHLFDEEIDGLFVGNPDSQEVATVQLYRIPIGKREQEPVGDPVALAPGESYRWELDVSVPLGTYSEFQTGGLFRIVSDLPVVAYLHSPLASIPMKASNDASMLLPEEALRLDYVVASYPPHEDPNHPQGLESGRPSYFTVIALEDGTVLRWTPPVATAGTNLPIPAVEAGSTGELLMNRYDRARIAASALSNPDPAAWDVSGTIVSANKPIWVVGATKCAYVPIGGPEFCDHLQEQLVPLEHWGTRYVAPHPPLRGQEKHYWRIYAADEGITVSTTPQIPGTPHTFSKRGEWIELVVDNGVSFVITADGPVMPVGYLAGKNAGAGKGDPSMYQTVPVEQFLKRYPVVTGEAYSENYVQVIREKDGPDIRINGSVIPSAMYETVGDFEVATMVVTEGFHLLESDGPFGVLQFGYTSQQTVGGNSYAYPGGMKVETIYVP